MADEKENLVPDKKFEWLKFYIILALTVLLAGFILFQVYAQFFTSSRTSDENFYNIQVDAIDSTQSQTQTALDSALIINSQTQGFEDSKLTYTSIHGSYEQLNCTDLVAYYVVLIRDKNYFNSPEIQSEMALVRKQANKKNCPVPEPNQLEKECKSLQTSAQSFFSTKNYQNYFNNTKDYIFKNCDGKVTNICQQILDSGEVMGILAPLISTDENIKFFNDNLNLLKKDYYANPECNKPALRCENISSRIEDLVDKNKDNQTAVAEKTLINADPASFVFKDDEDYFANYCGCKTLLKQFGDSDINKLPISTSQKIKISVCKEFKDLVR